MASRKRAKEPVPGELVGQPVKIEQGQWLVPTKVKIAKDGKPVPSREGDHMIFKKIGRPVKPKGPNRRGSRLPPKRTRGGRQ